MSLTRFDYRVLSRDGEVGVYEVYYDEGDTPRTSTADPLVTFTLQTVDGLRDELEAMLRALDQPVLNYNDVNGPHADRDVELRATMPVDKTTGKP